MHPYQAEDFLPLKRQEARDCDVPARRSRRQQLPRSRSFLLSTGVILLLTALAIIGPVICPNSYETTNAAAVNLSPGGEYWFGTDPVGRDLFARVWQGVRVSILIGIVGAVIPQLIGCVIGCISGYWGGRLDSLIMSAVDIGVCIPQLVCITLITLLLGNGIGTLILAISLCGWMDAARTCRSRMLQFRSREFVLAAQTQGMTPGHIICRHILPNILGQLIVSVFAAIPGAIFSEAYLSFIGLGIVSPMTSLGQLCKAGISVFRMYPYQLWIPGVILSVLILAFHILGNSLRDVLDPREGQT